MGAMSGEAWPSLIAVAGTLLGATVTYLFQKKNAERAETRAREQARRNERLAACEAFAGAVVDFLRGEYDRVHQQLRGDPRNEVYRATLDQAYRLRSAAQHALLRIRLICDEATVVSAAQDAFDVTTTIHDASSVDEVRSEGERANAALDRFIQAARISIR